MGTDDVCLGNGAPKDPSHFSLPGSLNAKPGETRILLDGKIPTHYRLGVTHRITIIPSNASSDPTWFLVDAASSTTGVGRLSRVGDGNDIQWALKCGDTRAAFFSPKNAPVDILWTAPNSSSDFEGVPFGNKASKAVALRVAAATSLGNISVNAVILNSTAAPLPAHEKKYFCVYARAAKTGGTGIAIPRKQCIGMPVDTPGASTMSACEAECYIGNGTYFCARCSHVYDPAKDDPVHRRAFEDLPDSWVCPTCGAPKSAYAKQIINNTGGGTSIWAHH